MKVIFLDHDGVICLSNNWGSRYKKQKGLYEKSVRPSIREIPVDLRFDNFDQKSIKVLNSIIEKTNAEIVISSDWKSYATLEELGDFYENQGICKRPIDLTPNLSDFDENMFSLFSWKGWTERIRCLEIQEWLKRNSVDRWIAIDDLDMSHEYLQPGLDFFVLTPKSNEGIKQCGISNKIISSLNEVNI